MSQAVRGLKTLVDSLDILVSSPLVRAVQTAEILADAYDVRPSERAELVPTRRPTAFLEWLRRQPQDATVAAVGHEPHLGLLASWLLTGLDESHIEFKKGAVCRIDFKDKIAAGHGTLRWFLTARQLRAL